MRALLLCALALAVTLGSADALAEQTSISCPANTCDGATMGHYKTRAVILDFVDPQATMMGGTLSRLLWRETIYAISDMSSTAIVHAPTVDPGSEQEIEDKLGDSTTALLGTRLHGAAIDIAEVLKAQMAIWGAVVENGDQSIVYSFLSVRPNYPNGIGSLTVGVNQDSGTKLVASLSQSDFNFEPMSIRKEDFFQQKVRVRCNLGGGCKAGVFTLAEPRDGAPKVGAVSEGQLLSVVDLSGKWLGIKGDNGRVSYLNIYHADIAPPRLFVRAEGAMLRARPGGELEPARAAMGKYDVAEMVRVGPTKLEHRWYRIKADGVDGWVDEKDIDLLYRFSATHFVAGLFRYRAGQFSRAEREFTHFLEALPPGSDGVLRSTVLQLLAACRIDKTGLERSKLTLRLLDAAALLTPFDPAIFNIRAIVDVHGSKDLTAATHDLGFSVKLEDENPDAVNIARTLLTSANSEGKQDSSTLIQLYEITKPLNAALRGPNEIGP